ncbi:acyloxyacyl hydrolase [Polaribacter cellanae]|uniref:Acyloxyacyl hydrolase n=2 Tax=Polaribacter cellanae TaxID=2818493 RepID=A0A975CQU1_9FLAO|nr:acyloxyacyl hydrolase [Polaribacter cellanae]
MHLYAFELGFVVKKKILRNLDIQLTVGLGVGTIDTRTERLAKGFTFIENGSLGFSYKTSTKTYLYIGSNIGHVSNFDTQLPNNGYNIVGFEVGFSYKLQ